MPELVDAESHYRELAGALIDGILDLIEEASSNGVEVDPLSIILERLQARGETLDLSEAPPMMRMILGGLGG